MVQGDETHVQQAVYLFPSASLEDGDGLEFRHRRCANLLIKSVEKNVRDSLEDHDTTDHNDIQDDIPTLAGVIWPWMLLPRSEPGLSDMVTIERRSDLFEAARRERARRRW